MKRYSFRSIISFSLIIVVGAITFLTINIYNNYLANDLYRNAEKEIVSVLGILQDEYIHTLSKEGGKVLQPLLDKVKENNHILHAYLLNSKDSLTYQSDFDTNYSKKIDYANLGNYKKDEITIKSFSSEVNPFLRAYLPLKNSPKCYDCHNLNEQHLGLLIFDISLADTRKNLLHTEKFSIIYSVILIMIILAVVFSLHYSFVKKSLRNFHNSINIINCGNLNERISIPVSRELAELGNSFNQMVNTFQKTQEELNIYHKRELESALKLATVGEMSARLAHEIRNPLTGIKNAIEIIVKEMPDDQNKPVLEEIQRQVLRLNNAVSNMLRFSRNSDLKLEACDLNEIIEALVFFVKNQTQNKKIEFILDLQSDLPRFNFDREQIENVLLNLGINSIQAIKEQGTIIIKTEFETHNNVIKITVEDNGCGIPDNIINRIFEPFYTTRTEGTGLGLAIAKEIIEKHNGKIWMESQKEKGTRFYISLPLVPSSAIT
jgi:signal transduction histidine kinase